MTNGEKWKDEIVRIAIRSDTRPAIKDGIPISCRSIVCEDCDLDGGECSSKFVLWLYDEYKEKPKLTQREWHFLEGLKNGFICKPDIGRVYYTYKEPSIDGGKLVLAKEPHIPWVLTSIVGNFDAVPTGSYLAIEKLLELEVKR